jgi:hypothetical protein
VRDYWIGNDDPEHKFLLFNVRNDTISVSATICEYGVNPLRLIKSEEYIGSTRILPKEKLVFDYPNNSYDRQVVKFFVNEVAVGTHELNMSNPSFDIPKKKIISRGGRNLWFVLEDMIVPFEKNIKFTMIMECRKNEYDPYYLLVTQFRANVNPKDGLVIKHNDDILYETRIDFPEFIEGKHCYKRIDVTFKDLHKSNEPYSPEFNYRVARGPGSFSGGNVPIIIWNKE